MKLDVPDTLTFHGTSFRRHVDSIYKSEDLADELYLDTDTMQIPSVHRLILQNSERVKVQIIVNHIVAMESKWCKSYEEALSILEIKTKPFTKLGRT